MSVVSANVTMSAHTSPSPSRDPFVAASPQSNNDESTIYNQITLGSRVKALLATLDDDSDEDPPGTGTSISLTTDKIEEHGSGTGRAGDPVQQSIYVDDGCRDDDDDEDSDVIRPHGRLAARLVGNADHGHEASADENASDTKTNAYDRIRKQLLANTFDTVETTEASSHRGSTNIEQEIKLTRKFLTRKKQPMIIEPEISHSSRTSTPLHDSDRILSPTSRQKPDTPPRPLISSPGLFLTPKPAAASTLSKSARSTHGSDTDSPLDPQANNRFLALVAKKRAERQAKVAAEDQKSAERQLKAKNHASIAGVLRDDDIEDDSATEDKLTQQARPTRKASKRALEEMNRETQRMSRNMQLAHQAKTNKKVTKESLLAKFNFRRNQPPSTDASKSQNSSIAATSTPVSDVECIMDHETPPTSPFKPPDLSDALDRKDSRNAPHDVVSAFNDTNLLVEFEEELPNLEDVMSTPIYASDKGKSKAVDHVQLGQDQHLPKSKKTVFTHPPIRVRPPKEPFHQPSLMSDHFQDDLEIIHTDRPRARKMDVFDRLQPSKVQEGRSLQTLRVLAQLSSPGKRNDRARASMTPGELQFSLQRRARQQAARERADKIQDLKDRGIIIQTTEERQRDQADVEDLLEKARREGEELTKKEKNASKKERQANGLDEDASDEDEDYKDVEADGPNLELSGSDDEADDEDQASDSEEGSDGDEDVAGVEENEDENGGVTLDPLGNPLASLISNEAVEESDEEMRETADGDSEDDDAEELVPAVKNKRRHNPQRIVDDEDEEDDGSVDASTKPIVEEIGNPFAPGLPGSDNAPMGLTQAFEATMAESQTSQYKDTQGTDLDQDSLTFLRAVPDPDFPMFDEEGPETVVPDSQTGVHGTLKFDLHLSQSQIQHETPPIATQYSDIPDPTQDAGFGCSSPLPERFLSIPPSTVDTVVLAGAAKIQSPFVKKKGRLRRRGSAVRVFSDEENVSEDEDRAHAIIPHEQFKVSADAFDVMKMASKKNNVNTEIFDKKRSDAKGMVEEQAEESEDEYAGLGGASDDDSMAEDDEEVRKMIDEGEVKVDERKLAAFFAYVISCCEVLGHMLTSVLQ